ncbi:MAG: 2-hydroxyacid dehydrogenase [Candidatus Asgardarchaeia archaeon]
MVRLLVMPEYENIVRKFKDKIPEYCQLIFYSEVKEDKKRVLDVDIVFGYRIPESLFDSIKNLKLIQVFGAGVSLGIIEAVRRKKLRVKVCNTHGNRVAVAEHAFALMLAVSKNIVKYDSRLRDGFWSIEGDPYNTQLLGKTVGIIGLGSIGQELAKRCKAFGMRVLGIKRHKDEELRKKLGIDFVGGKEDLDYVLMESDFIVLCVPRTRETIGMIGDREFKLMKKRPHIINVSRGNVIQEDALYKALREGLIRGAGIDVWYIYPKDFIRERKYPSNKPFWELDNVVMTPHVAWKTKEAEMEQMEQVLENIRRIHSGEEPINVVDVELGY